MNWRRIASVTTGGKPYFFRADGGRSVVWHRGYRQYHATAHGQSLGFFDNVQDAKKAAEKAVGVNPIQRGRTMKKYFRVKRRRNPVFKHRGTRKTATMETRDSDGIHIRYHNTEIVTAHTDGRVTLRSGGWLTSTTKKRMNQVADAFALNFQVYQKRHNWFVVVGDKTLPFTDGMTFSPLKKNPKHRARRAARWAPRPRRKWNVRSAMYEIQANKQWLTVTHNIFRSWGGKRRLNGKPYHGPMFYLGTKTRAITRRR